MDVGEIIELHLKSNNYDGLVADDSDCACGYTSDDLFHCGGVNLSCEPAYGVLCLGCKNIMYNRRDKDDYCFHCFNEEKP